MGSVLCGCLGGDCRSESKDKTDGGKGKHDYFIFQAKNCVAFFRTTMVG